MLCCVVRSSQNAQELVQHGGKYHEGVRPEREREGEWERERRILKWTVDRKHTANNQRRPDRGAASVQRERRATAKEDRWRRRKKRRRRGIFLIIKIKWKESLSVSLYVCTSVHTHHITLGGCIAGDSRKGWVRARRSLKKWLPTLKTVAVYWCYWWIAHTCLGTTGVPLWLFQP